MQPLSDSILKTLAYFDIFGYPLLPEEIRLFLSLPATETEVNVSIMELENEGCIFRIGSFYSLHNDQRLIQYRKDGNTRAIPLLQTANRVGRILYRFPFVRAVGISGSLSKNFAAAGADIDFFIITAPNRLWIARTLMHFLKKLSFLSGREHWFCMNYYISTDALLIGEKNIFTATEIVTLMPVCGKTTFEQFFTTNSWIEDFFPNTTNHKNPAIETATGFIKLLFEKLLGGYVGNRLDNHWMKLTTRRWLQKQDRHKMNNKGEPLGLKTSKQTARPAPENFQKKILELYAQKIKSIKQSSAVTPNS